MTGTKRFDITNFNDPRVMALLGLTQGLLASSGYSARPISAGEALANGLQGGMQGYMQGQHMQQNQQDFDLRNMQVQSAHNEAMRKLNEQHMMEDTIKKFQNGGSRKDISSALINSGMPGLIEMGLKLAPKVKTTAKGLDAVGNPVIHNIYDTGETDATGIRPAERLMQINRGGQIDLANPFTGQAQAQLPVSMNPGQAAQLAQSANQFAQSHGLAQQNAAFNQQKSLLEMSPEFQSKKAEMIAGGREAGKLRGEASLNLPGAISTMAETLNLSDDLKNHPSLEMMTGTSRFAGDALAAIGGNKEADFKSKFEQASGKQFLSAIAAMRGFGALTEREGDKMQSSASSMSRATNVDDFRKAQDEYQQALLAGVRKVAKQAGVPESDAMQMISKERNSLRNTQIPVAGDGWGDLR